MDPPSIYKRFFGPDQQSNDDAEEQAVTSAIMLATTYMSSVTSAISSPSPHVSKRAYIERDRTEANNRLMADYLCDSPRYKNPKTFRRRFRMSKHLFMHITNALERELDYFKQNSDGRGTLGFTAIQKVTSAVRVLAYENTVDINDEYLKMTDKTTRETLEYFCYGILKLYGPQYLREPNCNDLQRLYEAHTRVHGFPGMIGSVDCVHWEWATCPTAWRGQFTRGDQKGPTVSLQAIATYDLWIWSAFFGVPGSNNDITILELSPMMESYISGTVPVASFWANDNFYHHGYYLGDGIYPEYAIIVKTFRDSMDEKRQYFKKVQKSATFYHGQI